MKWLLNSWGGRLYIVVQITCLAVTITHCMNFFEADRDTEWNDLRESQSFYQSGFSGLDKESQQASMLYSGGEIVKRHSKQRQDAILYCTGANLAVPALFGVAFFIVKGLPKRKN